MPDRGTWRYLFFIDSGKRCTVLYRPPPPPFELFFEPTLSGVPVPTILARKKVGSGVGLTVLKAYNGSVRNTYVPYVRFLGPTVVFKSQLLVEPSGPEARARVFVHVLYEFRDY